MALAACSRRGDEAIAAPSPHDQADPPPLRRMTDTPLGVALSTGEAADAGKGSQAAFQFSQLTPSWEMKMEYILQDDGGFRFDAPDALADFAASRDMRLHGHTLVWYAQSPAALKRLDGDPKAFDRMVAGYIATVGAHYRGRVAAWDVVNEAVEPEGQGLRDCMFSRNQGGTEGYISSAFRRARRADPDALLILNDYDLESKPAKRATFMRLAERLLHLGAPLQGLGCQSHIDIDLPDGASRTAIADLASLGLPVHVSEMDVSTEPKRLDLRGDADRLQLQARRYGEVLDAFMSLPERQRYAFTVWGLRDPDSWMRKWNADDQPLLFDGAGAPKPAFWAVADRLRRG